MRAIDDVAQTNDFEAPEEQVEIPKDQDAALRNQQVHTHLLNDLVKHMWIHNGNQGGNA